MYVAIRQLRRLEVFIRIHANKHTCILACILPSGSSISLVHIRIHAHIRTMHTCMYVTFRQLYQLSSHMHACRHTSTCKIIETRFNSFPVVSWYKKTVSDRWKRVSIILQAQYTHVHMHVYYLRTALSTRSSSASTASCSSPI
jgi:hypothetical protein